MDDQLGKDVYFDFDFKDVAVVWDMGITTGRRCLVQDIVNRLLTPKGSHFAHPDYGSELYLFIQDEDTPINRMDLEQVAKIAIEEDPRIITGSTKVEVIEWNNDKITFTISTIPILDNTPLNMVVGYGYNITTVEVT
ncbi:MAG: hypothetical protein PWQ97_437 [Tepidanaerobacteraceae bacterium]|nr:hypothetical protein [Tepidanaerobacteraceae bacterium]